MVSKHFFWVAYMLIRRLGYQFVVYLLNNWAPRSIFAVLAFFVLSEMSNCIGLPHRWMCIPFGGLMDEMSQFSVLATVQ